MTCVLVYTDAAGPVEVPLDEFAEHIEPKRSLVWIQLDEPPTRELTQVTEELGINDLTVEDLEKAGQRTKLEHYFDHFHVAIHDCELRDGKLATQEIDLVFGDGWLLSVRQPPPDDEELSFPIDTVRRRFESQREQYGSVDEGFLVWALLDVVVDRYFVVIGAIDDRLDEAESVVFPVSADRPAAATPDTRPLFDLNKSLVEFRRAVAPLREVVNELLRGETQAIEGPSRVHFQDIYDHVLRVIELIEAERDVLMGLRDAQLNTASNRMNENMQRLTSWGAILIVATLLTGILGMNFRNAPELDWEEGFLAIFGIIMVLGLLMWWYFRRKGWL